MREDFAPYVDEVRSGLEADTLRSGGLALLVKYGMTAEDVKGYLNDGLSFDEIIAMAADCVEKGEPIADPDALGQPPPSTLDTITAADLQKKDIPPIKFIVEKLIPIGLNILASPPKYGKSWMVLALCLAVATGGRFLGYTTNKCGCLYLALEDSQRRLL